MDLAVNGDSGYGRHVSWSDRIQSGPDDSESEEEVWKFHIQKF